MNYTPFYAKYTIVFQGDNNLSRIPKNPHDGYKKSSFYKHSCQCSNTCQFLSKFFLTTQKAVL